MRPSKPVSLDSILNDGDSALSTLVRNARDRQALSGLVRQALPDDLKPHLVGANLRDGRLVLTADTAAWAARLRFHADDVLIRVRNATGTGAHSVKVRTGKPA